MDVQDEELRVLMMDIFEELSSSQLRCVISRVPREVLQVRDSSADVDDSCSFGGNWDECSHNVEVTLHIDLEAIIPILKINFGDGVEVRQEACIGDKDIDWSNGGFDRFESRNECTLVDYIGNVGVDLGLGIFLLELGLGVDESFLGSS